MISIPGRTGCPHFMWNSLILSTTLWTLHFSLCFLYCTCTVIIRNIVTHTNLLLSYLREQCIVAAAEFLSQKKRSYTHDLTLWEEVSQTNMFLPFRFSVETLYYYSIDHGFYFVFCKVCAWIRILFYFWINIWFVYSYLYDIMIMSKLRCTVKSFNYLLRISR